MKMEEINGYTNENDYSTDEIDDFTDEIDDFTDDIEDVDDYEDGESMPRTPQREDSIYEKYAFDGNFNMELPIADNRTTILKTTQDNRVVILQGDTGCGKTTQVPQYILDDYFKRKEYCNIICTQPRRITAISVAQRVCSERKWDLGSIVGYQVGLHTNASEDTRLLYCTPGVLLQKLILTKDMSNYTHIILDEVHERDRDMNFLLTIVRRLLTTYSPKIKVVVMSATIDSKENVEINYHEPGSSEETYKIALKLIVIFESLDKQDKDFKETQQKPSVLVFLPGINEIDRMHKTLLKLRDIESDIKLMSIRLHSMISADQQQLVFRQPPRGYRKVILSTNIAQSSITIPDVKYVIDFCLTKSLITDPSTNLTTLQLRWATRSNCRQRAGRAGRVMNGRVYRLVSKCFYENEMDGFGTPEMTGYPLENVVLKGKLLDKGPPHAILGSATSLPNFSHIRIIILSIIICMLLSAVIALYLK